MTCLSFIMHTLLHLEVGPILALSEPCSLTLNLSYNFDRLKLITCVWRQLNTLYFVFLAGLGYGVVVRVTLKPWTKSLFRSHSRVQKNTARVWPNRTEYNSIIDIHSAQKIYTIIDTWTKIAVTCPQVIGETITNSNFGRMPLCQCTNA